MIAVTLNYLITFYLIGNIATIMILSIVTYFYKKISSVWIVFGGAIIGYF
jgi:hypothetical protein